MLLFHLNLVNWRTRCLTLASGLDKSNEPCLTLTILQTLDSLWALALLLTALESWFLPYRLQTIGSLTGVKSQWWLMLYSWHMLPPSWSRRRRMELIPSPSDFVINWVILVQDFYLYCWLRGHLRNLIFETW